MFGSLLNLFLNSISMLLYCQYYYLFSFISFAILPFLCFIILALIALSEFLCCYFVGLLCYLLAHLTLLQDVALFKVSLYTYFTVRFMLTDFE